MALTADSGTYTDAQLNLKRRLAESMLDQSMDTSPISSNWQGLARLAKALIGGYQVHSLDEQAKAQDQDTTNALLNLPGLPSNQPSPTGAGSGAASGASPMTATPEAPASPMPTAAPTTDLKSFIKQHEKFSPTTYGDHSQDSNGFGTKALPGETGISPEEADKRLDVALGKASGLVDAFVPNASKAQKAALADLTYNTGTGWMNSGLGAAVKAGNWKLAQQIFLQYNKAGGETQPGLVERRQAMAPNLLITQDQDQPAPPVQVADASGTTVPTSPTEAGPELPNFAGGMPPGMTMAGASAASPQVAASGVPSSPPAAAQPAAPGAAPSPPQIDPVTAQRIQTLMANPRTRPIGLALYQEAVKRASPNYGFTTVGDQLVRTNPVTGTVEPVPGIDNIAKAPSGYEYVDAHDHAKGLRPIPGGPAANGGKYGKQGAVFQDPVTKKFYTAQFSETGDRLIREVTADGKELTPSRGVERVGNVMVDKATAVPIRDVGSNLEAGKFAEKTGELNAEGANALPKKQIALEQSKIDTENLNSVIDQAIKQSDGWTTGTIGSLSTAIPGTAAHNLGATLSTIEANLGFDKLQDMRNNSPTGGALGNVSDTEGAQLRAAWRSVKQSQTAAQLKENLQHVKDLKAKYQVLKQKAYDIDVARFGKERVPDPETGQLPQPPKVRTYNPTTGRLE